MNYQLELDKILDRISQSGTHPSLLLHSCCGPCSSYVLEYLTKYFDITVLYYNPNIWPVEEFIKRANEQRRLIEDAGLTVRLITPEYDDTAFYSAAKDLENEPEGGARCRECFVLRLNETAKLAQQDGYDYFTTTLSVSPHKNAQLLNQLGYELGEKYGVAYLPADFKKREGYKRSIELSKQYNLYRQQYCGCKFSYFAGHIEEKVL